MRLTRTSIKPISGFAYFVHLAIVAVIPLLLFILVRLNFVSLALVLIVLVKWRMFAVKPRFWPANIRANSLDMMVGFSTVLFMSHGDTASVQAIWALLYGVWLIAIKPSSTVLMVTVQSFIGQLAALSALYLVWTNGPVYGLTIATGLICFLSAHHFLDAFEEPYARLLAYIWGYFGAALAWLLSHWLLYYHFIAQPTLILSALGYGLAGLYYFDHNGRLTRNVKRQFVLIMIAIVVLVVAFSDWGGKVV